MTTGATTRGYWRQNPDGTRDWIETNAPPPLPEIEPEGIELDDAMRIEAERQRLTGAPLPLAVPGIPAPEVAPLAPITPALPGVPEVNPFELAQAFGLSTNQFVGQAQLADLALPAAERTLNWDAPFEQFLTWEQAQFLGFDVPEGSVVRMTPMVDGQQSFFLVQEPDAAAPAANEELIAVLRGVYGDFFDPKNSFGISLNDLPAAIIDGLRQNMATDYAAFIEDLNERADPETAENILRLLGVTEEHILLTMNFTEQEARVETTIQGVFPDLDAAQLTDLVENDWDLFVERIQTGGGSAEKRALLEYMSYSPEAINQFFSTARIVVPVDGVDKLVIVDVASMRAFDHEGNWVGSYNVVTHEFEALPEETRAKDLWDSIRLAGQNIWQQSKEWVLSALPNLLFRDLTGFERTIYGDESTDRINAFNAKLRDAFRREYVRAQAEFDEWIVDHPELAPPAWVRVNYRERLLEDPLLTILYEASGSVVYTVAAIGAGLAGTLIGGPAVGVLASTAIITPSLSQDAYEELLRAGVPEQDAAVWGNLVGVAQALLESLGNLVPLKHMFPKAFGILRAEVIKGLAARIAARTVMAGKAALSIEIEEIIVEELQLVVMNASLKVFNENQDLFEGWDETGLRTAVATIPFAVFGGVATSLQRVARADIEKLTEVERQEQGFEQDPETGKWYKPIELPAAIQRILDDQRGAIGKPAEVLKKLPTPQETTLYKELQADGASKGLDVQAIQGIAEGEYWVAITTKGNLKREVFEWTESLTDKGIDGGEVLRRLAGKFETVPGRPEDTGFGRRRFLPFTNLEDAKRFLETGDLEAVAKTITLKGTPWTPEQLAAAKEGLRRPGAVPEILAPTPEAEAVKQPWQMTQTEFAATPEGKPTAEFPINVKHRQAVEQALSDGQTVPPEVLADYPDLAAPAPAPPPEAAPVEAKATEKAGRKGNLSDAQRKEARRLFAAYISSQDAAAAWELTKELRRETRTGRMENMKARVQELIVEQGMTTKDAAAQAIQETMGGELPVATSDYIQRLSDRMEQSLYDLVYDTLREEGFELMSTLTALTNALSGKAIPRTLGAKGGSAYTRLARVFGEEEGVLQALDSIGRSGKTLRKVIEEVYDHVGNPAIPIDQATLEYHRTLTGIPFGYKTMFEPDFKAPIVNDMRTAADLEFAKAELELSTQFAEGKLTFDEFTLARFEARDKSYPLPPMARYETPINEAVEAVNMWPAPVRDRVIKVLKEIGWSPVDIGNFLRANKASFDLSFWRQQAPLIGSHPISFGLANVAAWNAIWSQKSAEASWEKITRDPLYQIYNDAADVGGDFLRPLIKPAGTAQWRGTEEFGYLTGERLIPRLTGRLWWVKISGRAFETGTNEHNWLIFKNYYRAMQRLSEDYASGRKQLKPFETFDIQKEMIAFAKMLANFTARGTLGPAARLAPTASAIFFAPRATIGRILSVKDLMNANPRVRREAWKNATAFVGLFGGLIVAGAAAGLWSYEDDPRSAEYMSIRVGNTRIDPWGGFRQLLVFVVRTTTGTGVSSVTGAEYDVDPISAFSRFFRGKASPLSSTIIDFWTGKNFIGEEVDVKDVGQWVERIAPFALQDIYEAYMEDPATGLKIALPAFLGAGVQTYTGDWRENWQKLGLPKYSDNFQYGMTEPSYDTADFWTDTSSQFKGVDPATLTEQKGFPDQIRAIAEARIINENLKLLSNQPLVSLNADPMLNEPTFFEYREMWQDRQELVEAGDDAEWSVRELQPDGKYKTVVHKGEEAVEAFDRDERTRKAHLGNMSQTQFALLNQYWAITDDVEQATFLEKHKAEIGVNARREWLVSHPKDNAALAIWGQAKIMSRAAYDEFNRLVTALDIPASALPPLSLPPEASVDNFFAREEAAAEFGGSSAEAVLILAQDADLLKWYQEEARRSGGDPLVNPVFPERYYELKVKNRTERERWDDLGDKEHDDYIEDAGERRTQFYSDFAESEYFDDNRRTEAIANEFTDSEVEEWVDRGRLVDSESAGSPLVKQWAFDNPDAYRQALEEGLLEDRGGLATEEERGHYDQWVEPAVRLQAKNVEEDGYWNLLGDKTQPDTYIDDMASRRAAFFEKFPDSEYFDDVERIEAYKEGFTGKEADLWAERGRLTGTVDEQSAEAKVWLVDHDGLWQKALASGLITDDGSTWNVPALRVLAKWRAQYDEYGALTTDEDRADYMDGHEDFRLAWHERNGLMLENKKTGAVLAERYIEDYVAYQELGAKGKRQERFLIDNPDYAATIRAVTGLTIPPADEVPAVQYDDIYDANRDTFELIERFKDNESDDFIPAGKARTDAVAALRFDEKGRYTDFGLAEIRRNGYGALVPQVNIDAYVGYYTIVGEGKPENWKRNTGTDLWFEDDWFMLDHQDFYRNVYRDLLGNQKWDFTKVPMTEDGKPDRAVFEKYLHYLGLVTDFAKKNYRLANLDLDVWGGLAFGWKSIVEQRRRAGLTPLERFQEEWAERSQKIQGALDALEGE